MMGRPRDSQRSKLYRAEDAAFPGHKRGPEPGLETVAGCQAFIDSALDRKLVQRHYPTGAFRTRAGYRVEVRDGRGHTRATGSWHTSIIQAPRWARTRVVLLHELAHVLTDPNAAAHGWQFAACFAFLVRQVMGVEAEAKLLASFKAHKVRYRKPRAKRTLTPEQREAAIARLAAAKEKS